MRLCEEVEDTGEMATIQSCEKGTWLTAVQQIAPRVPSHCPYSAPRPWTPYSLAASSRSTNCLWLSFALSQDSLPAAAGWVQVCAQTPFTHSLPSGVSHSEQRMGQNLPVQSQNPFCDIKMHKSSESQKLSHQCRRQNACGSKTWHELMWVYLNLNLSHLVWRARHFRSTIFDHRISPQTLSEKLM
jgi:hypothetical protein